MKIKEKLTSNKMKELVNKIIEEEEKKENISINKNPITFIEWLNHDFFKQKIKLYKGIDKLTLIKQPLDIFGIYEEDTKELFIYLNKFKKIKRLDNEDLIFNLLIVTYHEFGHAIQYEKNKFASKKTPLKDYKINFFTIIQQFEDLIINVDKDFYEITHPGKFLLEIDANLYSFLKVKELLQTNNPKLYESYKEIIEENLTKYDNLFKTFDFDFIFEKIYEIYQTDTYKYQNKFPIFKIIFENNSTNFKSITKIINETISLIDKKTLYSIITSKPFLNQLNFNNLQDNELITLIDALKYILTQTTNPNQNETSNKIKNKYLKLKDSLHFLTNIKENNPLITQKHLIENPNILLEYLEKLQEERIQYQNKHNIHH